MAACSTLNGIGNAVPESHLSGGNHHLAVRGANSRKLCLKVYFAELIRPAKSEKTPMRTEGKLANSRGRMLVARLIVVWLAVLNLQ
jgi:hypothetical protein